MNGTCPVKPDKENNKTGFLVESLKWLFNFPGSISEAATPKE